MLHATWCADGRRQRAAAAAAGTRDDCSLLRSCHAAALQRDSASGRGARQDGEHIPDRKLIWELGSLSVPDVSIVSPSTELNLHDHVFARSPEVAQLPI